MDNKQDLLHLLRQVSEGAVAPEDALLQLKEAPFEDLGYAKVDFHRSVPQLKSSMGPVRRRNRLRASRRPWEKKVVATC